MAGPHALSRGPRRAIAPRARVAAGLGRRRPRRVRRRGDRAARADGGGGGHRGLPCGAQRLRDGDHPGRSGGAERGGHAVRSEHAALLGLRGEVSHRVDAAGDERRVPGHRALRVPGRDRDHQVVRLPGGPSRRRRAREVGRDARPRPRHERLDRDELPLGRRAAGGDDRPRGPDRRPLVRRRQRPGAVAELPRPQPGPVPEVPRQRRRHDNAGTLGDAAQSRLHLRRRHGQRARALDEARHPDGRAHARQGSDAPGVR